MKDISVRPIEVFFYGLFMDVAVLQSKGIRPKAMRLAALQGYELCIGKRATLVRAQHQIVFGMLATLTEREAQVLYADPSVAEYRPELVLVRIDNGTELNAFCYNLQTPPSAEEHNPEYAAKLRLLAERLHLPAEYVASIR